MRVTILGASRFGAAIAEHLIEDDHEVILIDKDRDRLDRLSERLDCGMIEGDGTMPTTLREAYRDEADVFIAVTNASDDNILASLVARSVGFGRVIPQITAAELMDVCHELELDDVINPHATVAESICAGLEDKTPLDQETVLHNELALKRVTVPDRLDGQALSEIDTPETARAIALIVGEKERFADIDTKVSAGDCVLFAVDRDALKPLARAFAD
ncbi:NAD-binding protein [Aestuariivita sp.]|jgi:trk system potassium uptake protein TrkA|uniref:potassium channel family protein n=1 Tax=Aestuariivita sp. TaxID=1872407 RepID=UPI0021740173|nr:NAD-binding protein [Aestuariivita sp.]MCE8008588.1 NAD(P)-binding domain-containing protein [Aestuariivita sp.]